MTATFAATVILPRGHHAVIPTRDHTATAADGVAYTVIGTLAHTLGSGWIAYEREDANAVAEYLDAEWALNLEAGA